MQDVRTLVVGVAHMDGGDCACQSLAVSFCSAIIASPNDGGVAGVLHGGHT